MGDTPNELRTKGGTLIHMTRLLGALAFVVLLTAPAGAALALAPQYVSSEPEDGAKLHQAPDEVRATFSEPLDPSSEMIVEDHCGNRLDDGNVEVSANEMAVGIEKKPSGHYMVTYAAVGLAGATGTTNGEFSFMVHAGKACDGGMEHGHPGKDPKHPNEHENHPGKEETRHEGHNNMGHRSGTGGGDHSTGHNGGEHATASGGSHSEHSMRSEDNHGQHDRVEAARQVRQQKNRRLRGIATGESPFPALAPDSTAILLALALCAAFGGLGGWLLRVSAR